MYSVNRLKQCIILLILCLITNISNAQQSKFQLNIGYEHLFVGTNQNKDITQREWTWYDSDMDNEYFTARTSLTHAYSVGLAFEATKWLNLQATYKNYFRRYYFWFGSYVAEPWADYKVEHFNIAPYVGFLNRPDMSFGYLLQTSSWQFGLDFHHPITKSKEWHLHYILTLNNDVYEKSHYHFDKTDVLALSSSYINPNNDEVQYRTTKTSGFESTNEAFPFYVSANMGLALSKSLKNRSALKLEIGYRQVDAVSTIDDNNAWQIYVSHQEWINDPNAGAVNIYSTSEEYKFPLYLGGFYTNITYSFRPFRSKYDDPNYQKKKYSIIPKRLKKEK